MTTTQPSLDEQIEQIIEYWDFSPLQDEDSRIARINSEIRQLLRSQQKELLERVRMEVIGNDVPIYDKPLTEHLSPIAEWQNKLRSEQRKALDAIEESNDDTYC